MVSNMNSLTLERFLSDGCSGHTPPVWTFGSGLVFYLWKEGRRIQNAMYPGSVKRPCATVENHFHQIPQMGNIGREVSPASQDVPFTANYIGQAFSLPRSSRAVSGGVASSPLSTRNLLVRRGVQPTSQGAPLMAKHISLKPMKGLQPFIYSKEPLLPTPPKLNQSSRPAPGRHAGGIPIER